MSATRKELEAAPQRSRWDEVTRYSSIYLLPTRKKHDSGYHLICIVGQKSDGAFEKAAWCDDVCWQYDGPTMSQDNRYVLRTDMTYPSGICRMWGWDTAFEVGASLSSTDVLIVRTA